MFVGLVLGKPLGVVGASLLARTLKVGEAPEGVGVREIVGLGTIAGIGFTVGLFIAELAFGNDPVLLADAKIAILVASVVAASVSAVVLRRSGKPSA